MSATRATVRCTVSAISNTFKSRNTGLPYSLHHPNDCRAFARKEFQPDLDHSHGLLYAIQYCFGGLCRRHVQGEHESLFGLKSPILLCAVPFLSLSR